MEEEQIKKHVTDYEKIRFSKLKGRYKHYCPEWDYMAIDEYCHEFVACYCFDDDDKGVGESVKK